MKSVIRVKKILSIFMILILVISSIGLFPLQAAAAIPTKVVLVGDLQSKLGHTGDWDPGANATEMLDMGNGNYQFTGTLPAGTYHYKVAIGGNWDVSYGFGNYTNPAGVNKDGNILIKLTQETVVTFYYNHITNKIADSTYYTPLVVDKLPRVVGNLQVDIGDAKDWSPADAQAIMYDDNFDNIYSVTKDVYAGDYEYKIALGTSWEGAQPASNAKLSLPEELPVTFNYNAIDKSVSADFDVPGGEIPANTVRIHYQRTDNNYSSYGIWNWEDVATPSDGFPLGATAFPTDQIDQFGAYVDIPLKVNAKKIGFFVVERTVENPEQESNRGFNLLDKYNQLWIKQGDSNVYVSSKGELPTILTSAEVLSESKILLGFTMTEELEESALKAALAITDKNGDVVTVDSVQITSATAVEVVTAPFLLENVPFSVTYAGRTVSASTGWRIIDDMYHYEGDDLGATYHADTKSVTLKLWAPKASSVVADVYDKDDSTQLIGKVTLILGDKGVWSAEVAPEDLGNDSMTDLKGYFYQYEVTNGDVTKQVLDPYAKSMAAFTVDTKGSVGSDGDAVGKAAIVDLNVTDPLDFDYANIEGYEKREDAIIWEIHVRDFTSDPSIENDLNSATWGSYDAFESKLDYIKSLGVTHVQLLPVMAWYYGDETKMKERESEYSARDNEYNWGYDPHNYFSPDGAYSEDPTDPELRIKELKAMIDAIHDAGMGVLLDVVYTHMAQPSFLDDIVPNYYSFQDANGNNIGGFGNNLATSHKMAEKLMVDSVKYWFSEYKIDGMRWDMMGDATYDAVQNAYDAAEEINPNVLFIGEGWRTFGGAVSDPALVGKGADQDWMDKTDSVGVFSDEIRNELKSGFGSEGEPRFITGGARDINVIFNNIKAQPGNTADDDPGDMVQYIEAHDNLPLYDIIAQSIKTDPSIAENDLEIHKRVRLGNMLILTSQGTAFLHAGQEYGRTKQWKGVGLPEQKYHSLTDANDEVFGYFIHDSYDSSDAINMFDWKKATNEVAFPVNNTTREYTAGLMALRKSTDAFRLGDKSLVDSNVTLISAPEIMSNDLAIAYKNKSTDGTGDYYVFLNADNTARTLTLSEDLTASTVVVDNDEAGTVEVKSRTGFLLTANSITLDPLSAVIIKRTGTRTESGTDTNTNTSSNTSSNTNTPSNTTNATQRTVNVESLKSGKSIDLGVKENGVLLPLNAAEFVGTKPIEIKKGDLTVLLPSALLKAIQQLIPAPQSEGAIISFKIDEMQQASAESHLGKIDISTNTKLKLASKMFSFSLSVIMKDGKEVKVDRFVTPITLFFDTDPSVDKKLLGVYFIGDNGKLEYVGGQWENGKLKADVNHFSNYAVLEYTRSFKDLEGHWAQDAVKELAAKHVVKGTTDSTFSPAQRLTRAQFATMLVRALNLSDEGNVAFKDVDSSAWYASAVSAAYLNGLVTGKDEFTFAPQESITREEMAVMIVRAYKLRNKASAVSDSAAPAFIDEQQISRWAVEEVQAATSLGLMNGQSKSKFVPKADTSRAESAQAIVNLINMIQ
jgi:pullulanase